jgi:hypothetical protein
LTSPPSLHHSSISPKSAYYLAQQQFYDVFLQGCQAHHSKAEAGTHSKCNKNEANRIKMNICQPAGMWNYTNMGFWLAST